MRPNQAYEVSKYICEKGEEFHQDILNKKGERLITEFIEEFSRRKQSGEKVQISYSFMTKYCTLYSYYKTGKSEYPIYDSLVLKTLQEEVDQKLNLDDYNDEVCKIVKDFLEKNKIKAICSSPNSLSNRKWKKNHPLFFELMQQIHNHLGIEYRILDVFLWRRGREIDKKIKEINERDKSKTT